MLTALLLSLAAPTAESFDELFKPTGPVLSIKVTLDKANLEQLNKDKRKAVHGGIVWDTGSFKDVGVHLKGQAGSFREWNDKPALTINCDKFKKNQLFYGMDKFHLNNSVQDGLVLNEIILSHLFRAAGVPTARATHAFVECNDKKKGLYGLKEGYDKEFLGRWFKNVNGNLYDGGFLSDIENNPKIVCGDEDDKPLKALIAALRTEDKTKRFAEAAKVLEMDAFMAMWAIEVMGCDWDGYTRNKNNYKFYHDPVTNKFTFIPHGKDQMFQNTGDALIHGWQGLVARKLWETEEGRKAYVAKVKEVLEKHMTVEKLHAAIDAWSTRLKEPLNAQQKGWGDQYTRDVKNYKNAVKARIEWLNKEVPKLKP